MQSMPTKKPMAELLKSKSFGLAVAAIFFGLVGLGHALRVLFQWEVLFAGTSIPIVVSYVALIVSWLLCGWMLYLMKR